MTTRRPTLHALLLSAPLALLAACESTPPAEHPDHHGHSHAGGCTCCRRHPDGGKPEDGHGDGHAGAQGCTRGDHPHDEHGADPHGAGPHAAEPHGPGPQAIPGTTAEGAPTPTHAHAHAMPHRFEDASAWTKQFDAPERDAWQKPAEVIEALALPPDCVVADLGAGTGYFAMRLAKARPKGRIVGLDVEPDMVRFMAERARREGLHNFVAQQTPPDRAGVAAATDLVLVVDTFHHLTNRVAYFTELRAKLSPRGRIAVIDFRLESEKGPPRDFKLPPERVTAELAEAGFVEAAHFDFLPEQYFLVFEPRR